MNVRYGYLCAASLAFAFLVMKAPSAQSVGHAKADHIGGHPSDVDNAVNQPEEYAWMLFKELNQQALPGVAGEPDPRKPFPNSDEDQPVVWETWARESGGRNGVNSLNTPAKNESEVYLNNGARPCAWSELKREKGWDSASKSFEHALLQNLDVTERDLDLAPPAPSVALQPLATPFKAANGDKATREDDEVRMNQTAYEFLLNNNLYNMEGLEAEFNQEVKLGKKPISFDKGAQEVKAQWRQITDDQKDKYHWRTVLDEKGNTVTVGLVALHITTKDLPNWFWCDFEHEDYSRWADLPEGATAPKQLALMGNSKWSHYKLRGTQTSFTDSFGRPTILASSVIERSFQQSSSCITCHARASIGLRDPNNLGRANVMPRFASSFNRHMLNGTPFVDGLVGTPNPDWFAGPDTKQAYIQTDFMWSIPLRVLSMNYPRLPK